MKDERKAREPKIESSKKEDLSRMLLRQRQGAVGMNEGEESDDEEAYDEDWLTE